MATTALHIPDAVDINQDGIRHAENTPENIGDRRVTDTTPDRYPSGPRPVTCEHCHQAIPDDQPVVVAQGYRRTSFDSRATVQSGAVFCLACARQNEYLVQRAPDRGAWEYHHQCRHCRREFIGGVHRRYCSDACGEAVRQARRVRRPAQRLERACDVCQQPFLPRRRDARTCSPKCRQKAYRHWHQRQRP